MDVKLDGTSHRPRQLASPQAHGNRRQGARGRDPHESALRWRKRKENERARKVSAKELLENGCNLERKNPSAKEDITRLPPQELAASILEKQRRIAEIVSGIQKLLKS